MQRAAILAVLCVPILAHADYLMLDGPRSIWKGEGVDLRIEDGIVSMTATIYVTELTPDRIMRSSLDTSYWYWEIFYDGALGEGWGDCVLKAGPPHAVLICDD